MAQVYKEYKLDGYTVWGYVNEVDYYPASNPSGFISSGTGSGLYYPLTTNPSGYVRSTQTGSYLSQFVSINGFKIINGDDVYAIDYGTYQLNDASGVATANWNSKILYTASASSIDWANRYLYGSSETPTLDWENKLLVGNWTFGNITLNGTVTSGGVPLLAATQTGMLTGAFYPRSTNPSGYITSSQTGVFVTTNQTGSFVDTLGTQSVGGVKTFTTNIFASTKLGVGTTSISTEILKVQGYRSLFDAQFVSTGQLYLNHGTTLATDYFDIRWGAGSTIDSSATGVFIRGSTNSGVLNLYGPLINLNGNAMISGNPLQGRNQSISTKTANYTVVYSDDVILFNPSASTATGTLPPVTIGTGKEYVFKLIQSGKSVVILPSGSQKIDDEASVTLVNKGQYLKVISDGSQWRAI
jgi:hypothetical protein